MPPLSARLHRALVTAKYGLTGLMAVLLASWLVPKDVLSAAFVGLMCVQPSLVSGLRTAREQVLASALGAASTLGFLLLFPVSAWTTGASIATTYAVATAMRWGYPALVVALFSSLYMTLLAQQTPFDTALLRFQSVLLGVGVGIAVNTLFAPLVSHGNMAVRLRRSLQTVREQLATLHAAFAAEDAPGLEAVQGSFQGAFSRLQASKAELADMGREVGLPWRRDPAEVYLSGRGLRELELVLHHAQDVALAGVPLLVETAAAPERPVVQGAIASLAEALELLDLAREGHFARAHERSSEARARLQRLSAEHARLEGQASASVFSMRLVLLLALVQLHDHLAELVQAVAELEAPRRPTGHLEGGTHALGQ